MINWPVKYTDKDSDEWEELQFWNSAIDACMEAHEKWIKENECEMIDMQTGIRHRVIKLGGKQ